MVRHVFLYKVASGADHKKIVEILNTLPKKVAGIRTWTLGKHQGVARRFGRSVGLRPGVRLRLARGLAEIFQRSLPYGGRGKAVADVLCASGLRFRVRSGQAESLIHERY